VKKPSPYVYASVATPVGSLPGSTLATFRYMATETDSLP
jgi:hypothetical protein